MSDAFHPGVTESALDAIFAVMALSDWHIHQMLTKRVKRMMEYTRSVGQISACDILQARVARFAEANPKIDLRFFDRDAHGELADALSICGGRRVPSWR